MCRPIAIAAMIVLAVLVASYGVPGASTSPVGELSSLSPLDLTISGSVPTAAPADAH
jgi:hypothetical protein